MCPLQIQTHITDSSNTESVLLIWKDELHMVVQSWGEKKQMSRNKSAESMLYNSKTEKLNWEIIEKIVIPEMMAKYTETIFQTVFPTVKKYQKCFIHHVSSICIEL